MTFLRSALAATETIATGAWTGAAAGVAFIVAPIVAHEAGDLDVQARITGRALDGVAGFTYAAGSIALAASAASALFDPADRGNDVLRSLAGAGALAAIVIFQNNVVPEMTRLQAEMGGSFKGVPTGDPKRVAYRAAHERSTRVYGTALVLGLAQLILRSARRATQ